MKKKIFSMHVDVDDFLPASEEEKAYMVKKVVEGRICTMYSFSASDAGAKQSRSGCMDNFLRFIFTCPPYSRLMRGSTTLYRMSLSRFITTIREASTMVVPMIRG